MTPDVEFLVRQSLAVRSVADTRALLARSLFDPPSRSAIDRVSKSMNRMPKAPELDPLVGDGLARAAQQRMACNALLRRQLETRQIPSWPAMEAHWAKHGAAEGASALG